MTTEDLRIDEIIQETLAEQILEQGAELPQELEFHLPKDAYQELLKENGLHALLEGVRFQYILNGAIYDVTVRPESEPEDWICSDDSGNIH